jgi:hypothetical protein
MYEAKDGIYMMFGAIEHKFWYNFCAAVDRPDLRDTIRTDIPVDYGIERPWMRPVIAEIFKQKTSEEWMQVALDRNIPICVANTLDQVPHDKHMAARGMLYEEEHPGPGPSPICAIRRSSTANGPASRFPRPPSARTRTRCSPPSAFPRPTSRPPRFPGAAEARTGHGMKIRVNNEKCQGHARCWSLAPKSSPWTTPATSRRATSP